MEKLEGAGKGGNFQPEICTTGALDSGKLGGGERSFSYSVKTKGLITLCVDSLAFLFFSRF